MGGTDALRPDQRRPGRLHGHDPAPLRPAARSWPEPRVRVETTHAKSPGKTPPDTFTRRITLLDDPGDERRALSDGGRRALPRAQDAGGGGRDRHRGRRPAAPDAAARGARRPPGGDDAGPATRLAAHERQAVHAAAASASGGAR